MKRYYYVAGAVLIAIAVPFLLSIDRDSGPSATLPVEPGQTAAAPREPGALPPLPTIPQANLPDIVPPPDGALAIPAAPNPPATGTTLPGTPEIPAGAPGLPAMPAVPAIPTVPAPPIVAQTVAIPEAPVSPEAGIDRPNPTAPAPPVRSGATATVPSPWTPPPVTAFPPHAKFLVLRGKLPETTSGSRLLVELMACKFVPIDGIARVDDAKKTIVAREGAIVRSYSQADIVFVGQTRDDVCGFMRRQATDPVARLLVARWCMFNGMREQALTAARDLLATQPDNKAVAELVRSLEASLKQFPPEGSTPALHQMKGTATSVTETDVEVTPEAATCFATRIQPILANLCVDCHARTDYAGAFKLAKGSGYDAGPHALQTNMRAVAGQVLKSDPLNSPILAKALLAHGGLRQPPFPNRQSTGYCILEAWVGLAVGPGTAVASPGVAPAAPAGLPVVPASTDPKPASTSPSSPAAPNGLPGLPGVPTVPTIPTPPPAVSVPPVLPTPPSMTPTIPSQPPIVPAETPKPMSGLPKVPAVPGTGTQFGTGASPVPAVPPANRDEFDPGQFNKMK